MDTSLADFALVNNDIVLAEGQIADRILSCNEKTGEYGLRLTQNQALALAKTRTLALKESKRIEFGSGIVDKLIMAICDSPYISQEQYEDTIHEMISLFYELKNNTWDKVSDNDLIDFMKASYNGCCHGSMELVTEKSLQLIEHIHLGRKIDSFWNGMEE